MMPLFKSIKNWIAPEICFGCAAPSSTPLCSCCLQKLDKPNLEALPSHFQKYPLPAPPRVFSLWNFDKGGIIQSVQHALKYRNLPKLGEKLGEWLGRGYFEQYRQNSPDFIMPIPLSPLRFIERGYNQAESLAIGISKAASIPVLSEVLLRPKHTETQTKLSQKARWENMKSAFEVYNSEQIKGKSILLVDDILTTGATLAAASQCLLDAGAKRVDVATLAFAH